MSRFYREKRDVFEHAMRRHLSGLAEWSTPEAGMFFWCALFPYVSPSEIVSEIHDNKGLSSCLRKMARKVTRRASFGRRRMSAASLHCQGQYSCLVEGRLRTYVQASAYLVKKMSRRL